MNAGGRAVDRSMKLVSITRLAVEVPSEVSGNGISNVGEVMRSTRVPQDSLSKHQAERHVVGEGFEG